MQNLWVHETIQLEKRLCKLLGKPWSATGMSLYTLVEDLEDKYEV